MVDMIVVPLAVWLYWIALVAVAIILRCRTQTPTAMPGSTSRPPRTRKMISASRVLTILYWLFLVAIFAIVLLEIVRLTIAGLGPGLLPFVIVGIVTAGAVRLFCRGSGPAGIANALFWVMLGAANGVKIAVELYEGTESRTGTGYSMEDEITDVAVIIGLCAILTTMELLGIDTKPAT